MPQPIAPRRITTPLNVLFCASALCAIAIVFYAPDSYAIVIEKLLIEGLWVILWLAGAYGFGAVVLRAAGIRFQSVSLQLASSTALGLGIISLTVLALGLCGALNRGVAVGLLIVGAALMFTSLPRRREAREPMTPFAWLWLGPAVFLGIVIVCAFVPPGLLWGDEPHGYDVVEYHLQVPREWYEAGRIAPLPHNVYSYFPFNVEMHYLLAMQLRGGPWRGMYLAQLMHVCFVGLSVVAIYGVLRELNSRHATLGAVAAASVPWMTLLAPVAYNEGGLLVYGTLAMGLTLVAMRTEKPLRIASLAGAMAGFACGCKATAVPMILFGVPIAMLLSLSLRERAGVRGAVTSIDSLHRAPPHPHPLPKGEGIRIRGGLSFLLLGIMTFSPWFIRNWVWTRNPAFPEAMSVLGKAHFTDDQAERWRRAHSPREDQRSIAARAEAFCRQVLLDWKFGWLVLPLAIVAIVTNLRRGEARFLAILLLFMMLFWLGFTHLQGRFMVLAIPITGLAVGLIHNKAIGAVITGGVVLSTLSAIVLLHLKMESLKPAFIAIGREDVRQLTPLADVTVRDDEQVVLVGDARAFWYDLPMSRLQYRTVFDLGLAEWTTDVRIDPGKTLVVVDPPEMERFSRTYWKVPPVPESMRGRRAYLERR